MQYASRLPQPSRTLVVPLLAAALGAGVATATFALVNIEDNASVSLPAVVQSAPPSTAVAGERNDGGPAEGAAQQIMRPAELPAPQAVRMPHSLAASAATAAPAPTAAPRYDGGPNEGASADAMADTQPSKGVPAYPTPRYDGGPDEGASAGAIAQP